MKLTGKFLHCLLLTVTGVTVWAAAGDAIDYEVARRGVADVSRSGSYVVRGQASGNEREPQDEVGSGAADRNLVGWEPSAAPRLDTSAVASGPNLASHPTSRTASIRAIRTVFGARAPAAIRVASCETGGTFYARAVGRAGERGLFQIHPIHFSWAQPGRLFDPVWNSRVAYRLSRGGTSWRAWSCRWAA